MDTPIELFTGSFLKKYLAEKRKSAFDEIAGLTVSDLDGEPVLSTISDIVARHSVHHLIVDMDAMTIARRSIKIDAHKHFQLPHVLAFYKRDDEEKIQINGVRFEITIPYTGDVRLWTLQPNKFELPAPHAYVSIKTIQIAIEGEEGTDSLFFADRCSSVIQSVSNHLEWQRVAILKFNRILALDVETAVQVRKQVRE